MNFEERNFDWKKLKYNPYNDFLKAIDSASRIRESIKPNYFTIQKKTQATTKLGDLWPRDPEDRKIISDSSGSEKWMRLSTMYFQTSRNPELAKQCLNRVYVNCLTKLNRM